MYGIRHHHEGHCGGLWAGQRRFGRFGGGPGWGPGPEGGGGGWSRFGRMLAQGDLKLLALALIAEQPRHGYELSKLIETRSRGGLTFHVDSLYPLLYRLEERGWIKGRWIEKPGERRRRFYSLTAAGRRVLAEQRKTWAAFVEAVRRVTAGDHA